MRRGRRLLALALAGLGASGLVTAVGESRTTGKHRRLPVLSERVTVPGQSLILHRRRVAVQLRARRGGLVRAYVVVRTAGRRGGRIVVTRTGAVSLRPGR